MAVTTDEIKLWLDTNWPDKMDKKSGLEADLPTTAYIPTIYLTTDTNKVFIWIESKWIDVSGAEFNGIYNDGNIDRIYIDDLETTFRGPTINKSYLTLKDDLVYLARNGRKIIEATSSNTIFRSEYGDGQFSLDRNDLIFNDGTQDRIKATLTRTEINAPGNTASFYVQDSYAALKVHDYLTGTVKTRQNHNNSSSRYYSPDGTMYFGTSNQDLDLYFHNHYFEARNTLGKQQLLLDYTTGSFLSSPNGTYRIRVNNDGFNQSSDGGTTWDGFGFNGVYNDGTRNRIDITKDNSYFYSETGKARLYLDDATVGLHDGSRNRFRADISATNLYSENGYANVNLDGYVTTINSNNKARAKFNLATVQMYGGSNNTGYFYLYDTGFSFAYNATTKMYWSNTSGFRTYSPDGTKEFRVTNTGIQSSHGLKGTDTVDRITFDSDGSVYYRSKSDNTFVKCENDRDVYVKTGASGRLSPAKDSNTYLGDTSYRYLRLYADYSTSVGSDKRYKKKIKTLDDRYLNLIKDIRPVEYILKKDKSKTKRFGVIAQELEELAIKHNIKNSDLYEIGENGYYSVSYEQLIAPLIAYTQNLEERIDQLTLKVA